MPFLLNQYIYYFFLGVDFSSAKKPLKKTFLLRNIYFRRFIILDSIINANINESFICIMYTTF